LTGRRGPRQSVASDESHSLHARRNAGRA
jgi:hypothetical protein